MAGPTYDMEALIENIKRRCSVPTSQLTYTNQDFADLANDTLQGEVVPTIMSAREEFFVHYEDVAVPASRILTFPTNTVASKVRAVAYVRNTSPLTLINLPRIDLNTVTGIGFNNYNTLAGFYIQGNQLQLYPNTSVPVGTTIRIFYYKRTLNLTAPGTYGRVISVDSNTNTVVLDFVPNDWTTGTQLNAVQGTTPFEASNELVTVVSVSSPSVVLDDVTGIAEGDYISEYGFSAVPQVPIECQYYLAQLTAAKCLEGLGDREGERAALEKAQELKKNMMIMISQRVDGSVKKIVNPNGGLRLNSGLGRWGRGYWGSGY